MLYGECSIAAATAQKDVTLAAFDTLAKGVTVHVKFTNGNTAAAPTMKVGGTEAKAIKNPNGQLTWAAGSVLSFTYDGTNWVMNDGQNTEYATLTQELVDAGAETTGKLVTAKIIKDTVAGAIGDLDANLNGTAPGAGKTLTAFSQTDGKVSATFSDISITKSQVSDLEELGEAATKDVDTSITENTTSTNLPTSAAGATFVKAQTSGLTGAMHFIGTTSTELTDGATTATLAAKSAGSLTKTTGFASGDVVIYNDMEFVWTGSAWELLGAEGSYALKSNTKSVVPDVTFEANTLPKLTKNDVSASKMKTAGAVPKLTVTDKTIPNVTDAGSASEYAVAGGILTLKPSVAPTIGDAITVGSASGWDDGEMPTFDDVTATVITAWNEGSQASLTKATAINVVVP